MRFSNCLFWALPRYHKAVRRWRLQGAREGFEPVLIMRPSRSRPRWLAHFLTSYEHAQMAHGEVPGVPEVVSFKPVEPTDAPWHLVWTHLLFRGETRIGDFPDTKPERKE